MGRIVGVSTIDGGCICPDSVLIDTYDRDKPVHIALGISRGDLHPETGEAIVDSWKDHNPAKSFTKVGPSIISLKCFII